MPGGRGWPRHTKESTRRVAQAGRPVRPALRYLSQVVRAQARASPREAGLGLVGGSQSLGTGASRALPQLLLEHKACLPVGLKQLLEAGMEVMVLLCEGGPDRS